MPDGQEGAGREVAALAPWWDEKLSKPGEQRNTGRAEVKLLRPSEREREEKLANFFSYPLADCVCGQTEGLVLKLSYCIWNAHSVPQKTSEQLVKSFLTAVTWFCINMASLTRAELVFARGVASCSTFLLHFCKVNCEMLLYPESGTLCLWGYINKLLKQYLMKVTYVCVSLPLHKELQTSLFLLIWVLSSSSGMRMA